MKEQFWKNSNIFCFQDMERAFVFVRKVDIENNRTYVKDASQM